MRNLFESGAAQELKNRAAKLQPDSQRKWGTMTPAQAMAHCSVSLQWVLGEKTPPPAGFGVRMMGRIIKPLVLGNNKPLRRNTPTSPDLVVQDERNFKTEQQQLCALIDRLAAAGPQGCTARPHPFFGRMSPDEWAILTYKHLDHHLRQFGV
jgi:hypothetical protein